MVVLGVAGMVWWSVPETPKLGESFDFIAYGKNPWTRLYLAFFPSPLPRYPKLMLKDTVWKTGTTHRIKSNLYIAHGVTLTIEPGAKILLDPGIKITCKGHLMAEGSIDAPILFDCYEKNGNWDKVECLCGNMDTAAPVHMFRYCEFKNGGGLIVQDSKAHVVSNTFHDNGSSAIRFERAEGQIVGNKIFNNANIKDGSYGYGAGIMVYTDKAVLVAENDVHHNRSLGERDGGGGIFAFSYDRGKVTIRDNIIRDNYSDRHGGGVVAYACLVENNLIANNRAEMDGGGIYSVSSNIVNNRILENDGGKGGGVYAEYSQISENLIDGNTSPAASGAGVYFFGDGHIARNTFVRNHNPLSSESETIIVSGRPHLSGNNILPSRGGYALRMASHSLAPDMDARNNFWGIAHNHTIESLIYDWCDDSRVGMANWDGFRDQWIEDAPPLPKGVTGQIERRVDVPDTFVLKGVIDKDMTVGGKAGTIYQVTKNLLVRKGATLSIHPGTTFQFAPDTHLRVRGKLMARGTKGQPILFTGDPRSVWGALLVENRSMPDEMADDDREGETEISPNCVLAHCTLENGSGIQMDGAGGRVVNCIIRNNGSSGVAIRDASADIEHCLITGNHGGRNGGGIYAYSSRPVNIIGNIITKNVTRGDGGGVLACGYHANAAIHLSGNEIANNRCEGQGGGVWAGRSAVVGNSILENRADGEGGGLYTSSSMIVDNRVDGNRGLQGGGVYVETGSMLEQNRITGNRATDELGGGAYLNVWGMDLRSKIFTSNRVSGNHAADTGGVYLDGAMIFEKNGIYANQGLQLRNGNSVSEKDFPAPHCYWGGETPKDIDRAIFDQNDDPKLSRVDYEPYVTRDPS